MSDCCCCIFLQAWLARDDGLRTKVSQSPPPHSLQIKRLSTWLLLGPQFSLSFSPMYWTPPSSPQRCLPSIFFPHSFTQGVGCGSGGGDGGEVWECMKWNFETLIFSCFILNLAELAFDHTYPFRLSEQKRRGLAFMCARERCSGREIACPALSLA